MSPYKASTLSPDELQRYHRQLILPDVGEEGQARLKGSRILLVGAGGLGSAAALYLAAAGVGHLGIVDDDVVELSNLHRQVLHRTRDVGGPKVSSARETLTALNPHVDIATYHTRITRHNALDLIRDHDLVIDGSDNFQTRYLLNDACVLLGKPNVHGSVIRFEGQASVFSSGDGPCYRCLFPEPPPAGTVPGCEEGGVFGVLPGLVGVIQATEAIKLLTGLGEPLVGRLLLIDSRRMRFTTVEMPRNPACPACGTREITELGDYAAMCGEAPDEASFGQDDITPRELDALRRAGATVALIDVREPYEWAIARIGDARLVPLSALPHSVHTLDRNADTVVYCHHGSRSAAAADWLRDHGFGRVRNLAGGIDRWSLEVDASMRRY